MRNNGKLLERIVRLVQETLKNSSETEILSNHKLVNSSGEKREFDIVVQSRINDLNIIIAIECKDYKRPVPAEKIEAFESKCNRIKTINKKVFVSNSGYQSGAITAAIDFGIELQTANKINQNVVKSWFPVKKLTFEISNKLSLTTLYLDSGDYDLELVYKGLEGVITKTNHSLISIYSLISNAVNLQINDFQSRGIIEWMRLDSSKQSDFFLIEFRLGFTDHYIISKGLGKFTLFGLETGVYVRFLQDDAIILDSRVLKGSENDLIAKTLTVDVGNELQSNIVIRNDNQEEVFVSDNKGNFKKLDLLFTYDTKTDKFKKEY